jgi:hypothetical protein
MLCGDFNARVGCENDFITKDNNVFFKIKKIFFKDKPVKVRIHDG